MKRLFKLIIFFLFLLAFNSLPSVLAEDQMCQCASGGLGIIIDGSPCT